VKYEMDFKESKEYTLTNELALHPGLLSGLVWMTMQGLRRMYGSDGRQPSIMCRGQIQHDQQMKKK
jgi:hypothetical protein